MSGVYLSFPFCAQKCTYCNFASTVGRPGEYERYEIALEREVRRHSWNWTPETVYWGGGTPSLMAPDRFQNVMGAIPGRPWLEATLECAPGTLTNDKIDAWLQAGINRVSLGVQTFVTAEARRTGRKHTAESVASDVALLRHRGISNINIDLIAGLPGQTELSWRESLEWVKRLDTPHVSVYLFEVDEDSALGKEALLGGIRYGASFLPNDESAAAFYELALEVLAGQGLQRYEISNFARPGWESRHNLKYWRLEPYTGFGLDAHSFDGRRRYANTDDLALYLKRMDTGHSPCVEVTESDLEQEHFFVGLRQSPGIEPTEHEWRRFAHAIDCGIASGLLERDGSLLRLTPQGFLLSNEILQEFVGDECIASH